MTPRHYRSRTRAEGAEQTRQRIVEAAIETLRSKGAGGFSLDSVAKSAGVTRLTVYNRFGSRRALLEAVFDEVASGAGLFRLAEAMAEPEPMAALRSVIAIFCGFWASDRGPIAGLYAAASGDADLELGLRERNERRRLLLAVVTERLQAKGEVAPGAARDLTDLLFALTSYALYAQLAPGRPPEAVRALIEGAAEDAVRRAGAHGT